MQKKLVVFLWTHCSWKSSYAREFINYDKCFEWIMDGYKITFWDDVFAIWHYHNNCWWADWCWPLQNTKNAILDLCDRQEKTMVVEWVLLLSEPVFEVIRQAQQKSWREVVIVYLRVPEQEALKRVYQRNWWKKVWEWILRKKRYYDERIKVLENMFKEFKYLFIDTDRIGIKESVEQIKNLYR